MVASQTISGRWYADGALFGRLMTGTLWNVVASALNQGGSFLAGVAAARLLGQEAFGQYAIVISTLMSVSVVAQTGLGYSASKHIAEFRSADVARVGRILGLCQILCPALALAFTLAVAGSAPWMARHVLGSNELSVPLALGSVSILFSAVHSFLAAAISGLERYRALVAPSALSMLVTIGAVGAGASFGGVTGAVAGFSAAGAFRWFLYRRALECETRKLGFQPASEGRRRELPLLYRFALPATLSGYLIVPGLWFTNSLLVRQPDGYGAMALYTAAQSVRLLAMFVPQLINAVGLSMLNNVRGNRGSYGQVRRMNLALQTGCAAAVALVLVFTGRRILPLFGRDFTDGGQSVLVVLLAAAVAESALMGLFQSIQVAGRMWLALGMITLPWQVAFVALAWYLVPRWDALGLALSYLGGIGVALIATTLALSRVAGREPARGEEPICH
jgi:O-antigen/teichoic acid export membrane protein